MFSCCRANSKAVKSSKKDKHKKGAEGDEEENAEANEKKLVIPTITIENGKTTNDNDVVAAVGQNGVGDEETQASDAATDYENIVKSVNENEVILRSEDTATATNTTTTSTATTEKETNIQMGEATRARQNVATTNGQVSQEAVEIAENVAAVSDYNKLYSASASASTTTSNNIDSEISTRAINQIYAANGAEAATPATTPAHHLVSDAVQQLQTQQQQQQQQQQQEHWYDSSCTEEAAVGRKHHDAPPKSCLSRHNSTHVSIKKKVNISNRAEIIEPEPLPPPPYDHASMADDDDVFSDSLPPPKRDSMCAPYIGERDDLTPDAVAFAHGLPEWFNDERINSDIGCIEPPVTPVGRDELELKHQRLYADLLRAAHAAVEHSMRHNAATQHDMFTYNLDNAYQWQTAQGDCDPDLKPSVGQNLEHLVNRLEKLVERLERSVSARELEIANRTFDSVIQQKRASFDLEGAELPPVPVEALSQRIERIETSLNRINDRHSNSHSRSHSHSHTRSCSLSQNTQQQQLPKSDGSLENIPTVIEDYQPQSVEEEEELLLLPPPPSMSVLGYQDIVSGPLSQYLSLSAKIGGDVAKQAALVKSAFDAQLQYVTLSTQVAQPSQDKQMALLKPTSTQISAIQDYREKNRASPFFNHLSAISESIPALGWVCVSPTPGPHVKEMNDAGQFYTNRVLKEWKEKDATHVEWARAWIQTLTELQAYIKQYHTTGLVWSGKGAVPAGGAPPPPPPIGACPPPPPPPAFDLAAMSLEGSADERSALFAEINQGEAITKNLKKVTSDMQTHKNPTLRTGPAPFKPTQFGSAVGAAAAPATGSAAKSPVFTRDGKKWLIEYQKNNTGLLVDNAEMNNVVYVFKCEGSTLTVKGKVNNIVMDSCKKCSLLFDSVVASVEFVNCQSVQMQVLGFVPTIIIDKTDGCQMYLSKDSMGVEIVSSKSSEMNVMLPEASGDYTELALPEQFKTTISGKTLKTVCVDSLG